MTCNSERPAPRYLATTFGGALLCLLVAACGGGGGTTATAPVAAIPTPPPVTATLTNVQDVIVDGGPVGDVNLVYTSVTVCAPGDSSTCQTIDHILVDTGSTGLRLFASVLPASLNLPQQLATNGGALVECTQFADGYSWGSIRSADVRLGGETISAVPIQVIGDPAFPTIPADCSSSGPAENTVAAFGSNGVLGVGNFINDCGDACALSARAGAYYSCGAGGCSPTRVALAQQVPHPVSLLAKNNNGVLLRLPAVPQDGAVSVAGSLIFGIGTQTNNGLGSARVYAVSAVDATLSVSANGTTYRTSFVDSGSNGTFLPLPGVPVCRSGFYCPATAQSVAMVLQGVNGNNASVGLVVTNADALFRDHPTFTALPTLAGPAFNATTIDLGLPFFFGRTVYTAIEGRATPGGTGPYLAF